MATRRARRRLGKALAWFSFAATSVVLLAMFAAVGLRLTNVPPNLLKAAQTPYWVILIVLAVGLSGAGLYLAQRRSQNLPHVTRAGALAFAAIVPAALSLMMIYHLDRFGGFSQELAIVGQELRITGTLSGLQPEVDRLLNPSWTEIAVYNLDGQAYYSAETISDVARRLGVTQIKASGYCAEACTMLWLSLEDRSHAPDMRLGFAGTPGDHQVATETYRAALTFALVNAGVDPDRATQFISELPASGVTWIDSETIITLGVRSAIAQ